MNKKKKNEHAAVSSIFILLETLLASQHIYEHTRARVETHKSILYTHEYGQSTFGAERIDERRGGGGGKLVRAREREREREKTKRLIVVFIGFSNTRFSAKFSSALSWVTQQIMIYTIDYVNCIIFSSGAALSKWSYSIYHGAAAAVAVARSAGRPAGTRNGDHVSARHHVPYAPVHAYVRALQVLFWPAGGVMMSASCYTVTFKDFVRKEHAKSGHVERVRPVGM